MGERTYELLVDVRIYILSYKMKLEIRVRVWTLFCRSWGGHFSGEIVVWSVGARG